jgi:hypothetical protein
VSGRRRLWALTSLPGISQESRRSTELLKADG